MINLSYIFLNNELLAYIRSFLIFASLFIIFKIFNDFLLRRFSLLAKKTKHNIDDILIDVIKSIKPLFYIFISLYISLKFLNIGDFLQRILDIVLIVWLVVEAMRAMSIIINYFVKKAIKEDSSNSSSVDLLATTIKAILWLIAILFALSNLGINITSFVAGLGIGGIAIAFAIQNILSDLFSSFAIHFDKPFVVGDFIDFGTQKGTVKKIGIKTTRLKSLFGEEIIVSNKDLTASVIQNFKKMKERRVVFSFGITYNTPTKKIRKIPKMIEDIINDIESAKIERIHFKSFGESALSFEVSFYLDTPNYSDYMNIQQEINIRIMEKFEKEKIEFAYPTQTIYTK